MTGDLMVLARMLKMVGVMMLHVCGTDNDGEDDGEGDADDGVEDDDDDGSGCSGNEDSELW